MHKHLLPVIAGILIFTSSDAQKNKPVEASTGPVSTVSKTTPGQPGKTAEAYYNEGIKFKESKNYASALLSFKKAITINANYKEALYQAGWCDNELEKYAEALTFLVKAKSLWPNEPKVLLELGYANQKSGNTEEAKNNYNKCISLQEDNSLAYEYLGNLYYEDADYEKALQYYESYSRYESNITSGTIYYKMGFCQNELEKYDDAVRSLKKANELKADYVEAYNELGYAYTKLSNADNALASFKEALRINDKSEIAYNGIGDLYRDVNKDTDEALKNYFQALKLNPRNKKANYSIGWCYNEKKRYNEAVTYLKKALEIDKSYVIAMTELGYSHYALQNYDDALVQFQKALAIKKSELSLYYSGLCYIGKNQKSNATRMYEELKDINSEYTEKLKKMIDAM